MRIFGSHTAIVLFAYCPLTQVAVAGTVNEIEGDNQANNNTRATAQFLSVAKFHRNENSNVFGHKPTATVNGHILSGDVDWYSFAASPGPAYFDLDRHASAFIDTSLALYDDTGTLLALATDGISPDPGSQDIFDPFLGQFDIPTPGTYYIAVVERAGGPPQIPSGFISLAGFLTRPDGINSGSTLTNAQAGNDSFPVNTPQPATADNFNFGTYSLHFSGSFASFGTFLVWNSGNDVFESALGGASVPGGIDMKLINANITQHLISAEPISEVASLPTIEGFRPAGTSLMAWDLQVFTIATRFASAEIYFGYDEAEILAAGLNEEDLQIFHFVGGQWVAGGIVDSVNNEIVVTADTLSPFVLGVVIPEPGTLLLAMMVAVGLPMYRQRQAHPAFGHSNNSIVRGK